MDRAYILSLSLFGLSWAITDSTVLIAYILVLLVFLFHMFRERNLNLPGHKSDIYLTALILWRGVTALKNGILSTLTLVKTIKFLFDVSPLFLFRHSRLVKYWHHVVFSFIFGLSFITLVSFLELLGFLKLGFFKESMLEAFHRNHIKSGFAWSLGSLLVLILGLKKDRRLLLLLPILLLGLFYTQARSYYLGFIGAAFGVLILTGVRYSAKYILSGIALLSVLLPIGLLINPVRARFMSIFTGIQTDESIGCRLIFWKEGLEALRDNPIFGIGFGGWQDFFTHVKELHGYGCPNYHAHNIFIHEAVESGIVGFIILFLFLTFLTFTTSRLYLVGKVSKDEGAVLLIGVASLLNFMIGGLFEPSLVKSVVLIPTFTLVGFAIGIGAKLKSSP